MTATNIGSNERRGSEMPTERGSNPRLSLDTLDCLDGLPLTIRVDWDKAWKVAFACIVDDSQLGRASRRTTG